MNVYSLCGVCLCTAIAVMLLRELRRELIPPLLFSLALLVFLVCLPSLAEASSFLTEAASYTDNAYSSAVLRGLGISYLTSVSAELCRTSGEEALGRYLETAGKIAVLSLTLPLFRELLSLGVAHL